MKKINEKIKIKKRRKNIQKSDIMLNLKERQKETKKLKLKIFFLYPKFYLLSFYQ